MNPELLDYFENGEIQLRIYRVEGKKVYYIQSGIMGIEFDEHDFVDLLTLLYAFVDEGQDYD